ncbi:uncharacterized protein LOC119765663 [Culex quinquefasciatus]|uniref:uncharacterized protein LOC119765663 n=1 Tax=Culex quinquefasciatus TaxID=7176 RepID=UPI0018E318A0|nr:uncharacterized protein LOC119765663 [Culex quinquefasciatus]
MARWMRSSACPRNRDVVYVGYVLLVPFEIVLPPLEPEVAGTSCRLSAAAERLPKSEQGDNDVARAGLFPADSASNSVEHRKTGAGQRVSYGFTVEHVADLRRRVLGQTSAVARWRSTRCSRTGWTRIVIRAGWICPRLSTFIWHRGNRCLGTLGTHRWKPEHHSCQSGFGETWLENRLEVMKQQE